MSEGERRRAPRGRLRGALAGGAKLALAGGIFVWMVRSGRLDPTRFGAAFDSPFAVGYAVVALGMVVVLGALRWWLLLRSVGLALPLGRTFALSLIGCFFNTFLPGGVGGDAMRVVYVSREAARGRRLEAATTVFIDRLCGLTGLAILFAVGVALQLLRGGRLLGALLAPLRPWLGALAVGAVVVSFAAAVLLHPRVRRSARLRALVRRLPLHVAGLRMVRTFLRAVRDGRTLGLALGMSVLVHTLIASVFFVFARALGDGTPPLAFAVLVPLGMLVNTIPGPPQGLGVGEAAFEALFRLASGGRDAVGGEACLAWRLVANGWNLVGGLAYVLWRGPADAGVAARVPAGYDSPAEAGER